MYNLMRADMYKLLRSRGVYICLGIIIAAACLVIFVFRVAPASGIVTEEDIFAPVAEGYMTTTMGAELALGSINSLSFFFLAGIAVVIISVFSSGAIKNEITTGISRTKYYISKWLTCCIFSMFMMILYFSLFIVFASFADGLSFGIGDYFGEALIAFGLQLLLGIGVTSVGVFLAFVTRKAGATDGIYIAFLMVPSFVIALLDIAFDWAMSFAMYDMFFLYGVFANWANAPTSDIIRGVVVTLGFTIISTVAGIILFRRAEVK